MAFKTDRSDEQQAKENSQRKSKLNDEMRFRLVVIMLSLGHIPPHAK